MTNLICTMQRYHHRKTEIYTGCINGTDRRTDARPLHYAFHQMCSA